MYAKPFESWVPTDLPLGKNEPGSEIVHCSVSVMKPFGPVLAMRSPEQTKCPPMALSYAD
jgi:hypothetical protein